MFHSREAFAYSKCKRVSKLIIIHNKGIVSVFYTNYLILIKPYESHIIMFSHFTDDGTKPLEK